MDSWKQTATLGTVGIAFAIIVILLLRTFPGLQHFTLGAGPEGLSLSVDAAGRLEIRGFLDGLVADTSQRATWAKEDVALWAREHLGLVNVRDATVVDKLAELCPTKDLNDIVAYQQHVHSCEQIGSVRELRRRSLHHEAPFQPIGRSVQIGTPLSQPKPGEAFTCYDSEFENRRVKLSVPGRADAVEVIARGGYVCPNTGRYPDLQISAGDAQRLYGRGTREYETAVALVE